MKRNRLYANHKDEICSLYLSGWSIAKLALKFGHDSCTLSRYLERWGIQKRPKGNPAVDVNCAQCGKEFKRKYCELKKSESGRSFCSSSCAATYNDTHFPKRRIAVRYCIECGEEIFNGKKMCPTCNPITKFKYPENPTFRDLMVGKNARMRAHNGVRNRGRVIAAKLGWKSCAICGYDKNFEVAHLIPVSSFPDDTLISIINHLTNLIPLCRNCHWELDHGMLDRDSINIWIEKNYHPNLCEITPQTMGLGQPEKVRW